ncbi:histidine kinase N-terminal domain-containing protein [Pelosinus sp. sgz500959]|uniref:histidine kinase N-terminal domain-containing protein n=1 Tax=Pelosinus sp. sgz500959 TaxID=3242472 RepID=UPI003672D5BB
MVVAGDICRKVTPLAPAQIAVLDSICSILGLASDLAHAQVTVYAHTCTEKSLVIVAQVKPNTSFVQQKPNLLGTIVYAPEEPLVWRTMTTGIPIRGQREWAVGMWMEMQVYPVRDASGNVIGVVSFETSMEEAKLVDHQLLVETAQLMLATVKIPSSSKMYRSLSASDGILIVDEQGKIIFANSTADSIYKVLAVGCIVGRRIYERQAHMNLVQRAMSSQQACEVEIVTGKMTLVQRAIPVILNGVTICTVVILTDVTELKKKEKELLIKSAVIQEIHHRVKNNLQTIASLLRLQARRTTSQEVKAALQESVNRISSISVVHEFLSQQDAEFIDVAEVTKNILELVIQNMLEPDFDLQTRFNGQTVIFPSEQASSLALVINELIQNSIEHGFIGRREGLIGVEIATLPNSYKIEIYDNGIGMPSNFNPQTSNSLGLQIVRTLIESDVGGSFEMYNDNGTRACIIIPRKVEGVV